MQLTVTVVKNWNTDHVLFTRSWILDITDHALHVHDAWLKKKPNNAQITNNIFPDVGCAYVGTILVAGCRQA